MKPLEIVLKAYFGNNRDAAESWLDTPNLKLGGKRPNQMLVGKDKWKLLQFVIVTMTNTTFEDHNYDKESEEF